MKPESFDQQFASVFGDPETRRLAEIAIARVERRRPENAHIRRNRDIQLLRLVEFECEQAGKRDIALQVRSVIESLVESWRLRGEG